MIERRTRPNEGMLLYALDVNTDELKHVSQVARGKRCDCYCPGCGWPVFAIQGEGPNARTWHFRHAPETEGGQSKECTNPDGASETIIHRYVKETIASFTSAYLPAFNIHRWYKGERLKPFQLFDSLEWHFSGTRLEDYSNRDRYVPDVITTTERGELAIEVCYSHSVSPEKKALMAEDGLMVLEVSVDHLTQDDLGVEPVRRLIYTASHSKWIHATLAQNEHDVLEKWMVDQQLAIDKNLARIEANRLAREKKRSRACGKETFA